MSYSERYQEACDDQGFEAPLDESPIDTPDGWSGGAVEQTGGFIMVRQWRTHDMRERGPDYVFEAGYGQNAGVGINRYAWDEAQDCYVFDGEVTHQSVDENTDDAKAQAVKGLMEDFDADDATPN